MIWLLGNLATTNHRCCDEATTEEKQGDASGDETANLCTCCCQLGRTGLVRELECPRGDLAILELVTIHGYCFHRDRADTLDTSVLGDLVGDLVGVLRNVQLVIVDSTHIARGGSFERGDEGWFAVGRNDSGANQLVLAEDLDDMIAGVFTEGVAERIDYLTRSDRNGVDDDSIHLDGERSVGADGVLSGRERVAHTHQSCTARANDADLGVSGQNIDFAVGLDCELDCGGVNVALGTKDVLVPNVNASSVVVFVEGLLEDDHRRARSNLDVGVRQAASVVDTHNTVTGEAEVRPTVPLAVVVIRDLHVTAALLNREAGLAFGILVVDDARIVRSENRLSQHNITLRYCRVDTCRLRTANGPAVGVGLDSTHLADGEASSGCELNHRGNYGGRCVARRRIRVKNVLELVGHHCAGRTVAELVSSIGRCRASVDAVVQNGRTIPACVGDGEVRHARGVTSRRSHGDSGGCILGNDIFTTLDDPLPVVVRACHLDPRYTVLARDRREVWVIGVVEHLGTRPCSSVVVEVQGLGLAETGTIRELDVHVIGLTARDVAGVHDGQRCTRRRCILPIPVERRVTFGPSERSAE